MRREFRFAAVWLVILSAVLAACSDPASEPSSERGEPLVTGLPDFTRLVEKEGPAVVNISTVTHRDESSAADQLKHCLLYTSPSPRDATLSRMPSSA